MIIVHNLLVGIFSFIFVIAASADVQFPFQADKPSVFLQEVLRVYNQRTTEVLRWGIATLDNPDSLTYTIPRFGECPSETVTFYVGRVISEDTINENFSIHKCGYKKYRLELIRKGKNLKPIDNEALIMGRWPEIQTDEEWQVSSDANYLVMRFTEKRAYMEVVSPSSGRRYQLHWIWNKVTTAESEEDEYLYDFTSGGQSFKLRAFQFYNYEEESAKSHWTMFNDSRTNKSAFASEYNKWIISELQVAMKDVLTGWTTSIQNSLQ